MKVLFIFYFFCISCGFIGNRRIFTTYDRQEDQAMKSLLDFETLFLRVMLLKSFSRYKRFAPPYDSESNVLFKEHCEIYASILNNFDYYQSNWEIYRIKYDAFVENDEKMRKFYARTEIYKGGLGSLLYSMTKSKDRYQEFNTKNRNLHEKGDKFVELAKYILRFNFIKEDQIPNLEMDLEADKKEFIMRLQKRK